jgi:hypothetical protein
MAIFVHLASVWVPFTSEAKEAVAHYDEIVKEIRFALMECGRKLGAWVKAKDAENWEQERKSLFEKYIKELAVSLNAITGVAEQKVADDFHAAMAKHVRVTVPVVEGVAPAEPTRTPSDLPPGSAEAFAEAATPKAPAPKAPRDLDDEDYGFGTGSAFEDVTPNKGHKYVPKPKAPRPEEPAAPVRTITKKPPATRAPEVKKGAAKKSSVSKKVVVKKATTKKSATRGRR